LVESVEL
jgi:hypothetical protein